MFEFELPQHSFCTSYFDEEGNIKFKTPIYVQRYLAVSDILAHPLFKNKIKKIVDFGCAELKLETRLRRQEGLEHIIGVDIDETTVLFHKKMIDPLIADYLARRSHPLRIELLKGSIDQYSQYLRSTDAVIAIEIIEHLYPNILENVPYNIFGLIQPKIAIFSTPNSDFNILFTLLANGFRHYDHKFEWSQQQFKDWALNICVRFPNYVATFFGVGSDPENNLNIGPVSQFALFVRKDILSLPLVNEIADSYANVEPYQELYSVDYPYQIDSRTDEQKMYDDAIFFINSYRLRLFCNDPDIRIIRVPLEDIRESVSSVPATICDVRNLLISKGYVIEDECVVLPEDSEVEKRDYDGSDSDRSSDIYDETSFNDDDDDKEYTSSALVREAYEEEVWD